LLASAPDFDPNAPIYLRGEFQLTYEEKGVNTSERQVTHSNIFRYGELTGEPYVDDRGRQVFWDHFRKALSNLLTNNMSKNWKEKSPKSRVMKDISIVTVKRPDTKKKLPVRDTQFSVAMSNIASRGFESVNVTKVYKRAGRRYVDVLDPKGRLVESVPWKPQLMTILRGIFPEVTKVATGPVHVEPVVTKVRKVRAAPRVRPAAQTPSGEKLYSSRVSKLVLGSRYKSRGHYYVKAEDFRGRSYTLRWYSRLESDLRKYGMELYEWEE
jgi:hypothetical protein